MVDPLWTCLPLTATVLKGLPSLCRHYSLIESLLLQFAFSSIEGWRWRSPVWLLHYSVCILAIRWCTLHGVAGRKMFLSISHQQARLIGFVLSNHPTTNQDHQESTFILHLESYPGVQLVLEEGQELQQQRISYSPPEAICILNSIVSLPLRTFWLALPDDLCLCLRTSRVLKDEKVKLLQVLKLELKEILDRMCIEKFRSRQT